MTKQQIGAELKRLRTEAGLSLKQLADKSGESFQHISHIENGKYNLTLERLERVTAPLGVTVALVSIAGNLYLDEKSMLTTELTEKACLLGEDSAGWDI
jgi:transcriptional regulator with XRE-family HTH domain